jgi:hypothetical protein
MQKQADALCNGNLDSLASVCARMDVGVLGVGRVLVLPFIPLFAGAPHQRRLWIVEDDCRCAAQPVSLEREMESVEGSGNC